MLSTSFFDDSLYSAAFDFSLYSVEDAQKKVLDLSETIKKKYSDSVVNKPSTEVIDAYRLLFGRGNVKASLWVNPNSKIIVLYYWNDSVFSDVKKEQSQLSGKDAL